MFKELGLSDPLVKGILATGYKAPTEIQAQAIPSAVAGKDIIGCAQTGTGKTAAFVLPILDKLVHELRPKRKFPRSLILTPTRELAVQIEQAIVAYSRYLDIKTLAIYGGVDIRGQIRKLNRGVDIVVATPGRLIDHMQRGNINFNRIKVLVLDEADRMFDMGFIKDVRKIVAVVPENRQTMLFSATMSDDVKALTRGIQRSPVMIQIGQQRNPAETVTQHIYPVSKAQKMELLLHLLKNVQMYSVLVFSRTKHGADKICHRLDREGVLSIAIHSNRTQRQRQRALDGFRAGKYQVMVATDIAARGIDVDGISHVINYDVPTYAEDYLHRIGRTGRAELTGDAITFVSGDEKRYLARIEKYIDRRFKTEKCEGFSYQKSSAAAKSSSKNKKQKSKTSRKTGSSSDSKSGKKRVGKSGAADKKSRAGSSKKKSYHKSGSSSDKKRRYGKRKSAIKKKRSGGNSSAKKSSGGD